MTSQALISKIHSTLSANEKEIVSSMYNNINYVILAWQWGGLFHPLLPRLMFLQTNVLAKQIVKLCDVLDVKAFNLM